MSSATASGRSNLRVLVVEDDPNSRKVLVHALDAMKAELTLAENGQQAVEAFRKTPFDIVLMDLRMPVMDGYAATREIRAHESRAGAGRTPIVVVSAHVRPWEIEAAQTAGADQHLGKPINVPVLLGTIEAMTTPL